MMLPTILEYKLRQTYNTLNQSSRQKKLGWVISIAFIAPYYMTFTRSMIRMYGQVYENSLWEGLALMATGNLALVFLFVLISTTALTLYRMFQAKDLPLLMSLPVEDDSLFLAKLTESLTYAARNMILPFPLFIALLSVIIGKAGSASAAIVFALGWICIMIQLTSLAVILALILGRLIVSSRWGILLRAVAVVASLAFLLVFFAAYVQQSELRMPGYTPLATFLPTSWLVMALPYAGSTILTRTLCGAGFLTMTIVCPVIAFYLFKVRFRRLWMITMEVRQRKGKQRSSTAGMSKSTNATGSTRAVVMKEALVMRREPHTWIGLMILLVIFPVFIFFRASDMGTHAVYITIVSLLTTASYSLSCIGREGRSFALLRSLPIRMSSLLWAKFILGCILNIVMTLTFVIVLFLAGRSSLERMWHNAIIAAIGAIYLSAFGTALAAIFPKFDFTTPMRAASMPGLLVLYFIAFIFGFSFVGATTFGWYYTPLVLAPWTGVALLLMKIGWNRLEKMDV